MPKFVHDYVVVHELAHLKVPKHGPEFWQLVNRYPKTERACGYRSVDYGIKSNLTLSRAKFEVKILISKPFCCHTAITIFDIYWKLCFWGYHIYVRAII